MKRVMRGGVFVVACGGGGGDGRLGVPSSDILVSLDGSDQVTVCTNVVADFPSA